MNDAPRHPSFLALDRLALADLGPAEIRRHVAECSRCAEYVSSIDQGAPLPELVPQPIPPVVARRRRWLSIAGAAAVIAAAAAVAMLLQQPRDPEPVAYVGTKGQPSLALYVKRGEEVFAWRDEQFVMPGDRLRIEVASAGFEHITVLSPGRSGSRKRTPERPELLYDRPINPWGNALLPVAWQVDAAPGDETLVVVLSPDGLSQKQIAELLEHPERSGPVSVWIKRLVLRKFVEGGAP
jgi:hypothetical protein